MMKIGYETVQHTTREGCSMKPTYLTIRNSRTFRAITLFDAPWLDTESMESGTLPAGQLRVFSLADGRYCARQSRADEPPPFHVRALTMDDQRHWYNMDGADIVPVPEGRQYWALHRQHPLRLRSVGNIALYALPLQNGKTPLEFPIQALSIPDVTRAAYYIWSSASTNPNDDLQLHVPLGDYPMFQRQPV